MNDGRFVYHGPEGTYCSDLVPDIMHPGDYGHVFTREFYHVVDLTDFILLMENHYLDPATGKAAKLYRFADHMPDASIENLCLSMSKASDWKDNTVYLGVTIPNGLTFTDASGWKVQLDPRQACLLKNGKYF